MMTELVLVEGVSDVQLISYYLQNIYGWQYENNNQYEIVPLDENEHIENLSKDENQLILCGVGGNGKFAHFANQHRLNSLITESNISSLMIVTDRDEGSNGQIKRQINSFLDEISVDVGKWKNNIIKDSYGQIKEIETYLLVIPSNETGALEKVVINALNDIPEEIDLIQEVIQFIASLKSGLAPELTHNNKVDKATLGTFFSIRNPKNAMRSFGIFISKIDWSKSEYLKELFLPFKYLGVSKPTEILK